MLIMAFILTTKQAETLEDSLAYRHVRIDQTIEVPKPDTESHRRLIDLYGGKLQISDDLRDCVSAASIKDLT